MGIGSTSRPPDRFKGRGQKKAKVIPIGITPRLPGLPEISDAENSEINAIVTPIETIQHAQEARIERNLAGMEDESTAEIDEYEMTPDVQAQLDAGGHDFDYGEITGLNVVEGDPNLDIANNQKGLVLKGYSPGLTQDPGDKKKSITAIGMQRAAEVNAAHRLALIEKAEQKGQKKLLEILLNLHPDHNFWTDMEGVNPDIKERMRMAAHMMVETPERLAEKGEDHVDENIFRSIGEQLLNVWRTTWELHVFDETVEAVAKEVMTEGVSEQDIFITLRVIDTSTSFEEFDTLQHMVEMAEDCMERESREGKDLKISGELAVRLARIVKNRPSEFQFSFREFIEAMKLVETWEEGRKVRKVLGLPYKMNGKEVKVDFNDPAQLVLRNRVCRLKAILLNQLAAIKEHDEKEHENIYPELLDKLTRCKSLNRVLGDVDNLILLMGINEGN